MGLIQNKVKVSQPNSHVVVKNAGGLRGLTGETGPQGPQGPAGQAATVTAGTTTTLPAGSDATVQNVGSTSAAIFNFGIPKGDKGDTGESGAAATISVGTTTTLEPGEEATVTNSGTSSAAVFDFGIPQGAKGDTGATGPAGQDGADGFSPTATVTKTGDTATITITDKDGTTTAQISDGVTPTVDPALSPTSENPVQNKVVTNALLGKADKPIVVSSLPATGTAGQEYFVDDRYNTVTELKGDTQQTTYSGKNLAKPDPLGYADMGITASYDSTTGEITLTGTATGGYSIPFRRVNQTIPAGTYTIKQYGNLSHGRMGINFRRSDGTQITEYVVNTGTLTNTFTLTEAAAQTYLFTLYHAQGQTVEGTVKFQMEAGSTATSFEPYVGGTASPNPDYPQEVQTVTGEQTITITGKNLFNKAAITSGKLVSRTDGTLADNVSYGATEYIPVVAGQQYRFTAGFNYWYTAVYDKDKKYVSNVDNTQTITIPAGVTYIRSSVYLSQLDDAQFEKGSTSTAYEPYQGGSYPVNLGKNLFNIDGDLSYGGYPISPTNNGDGTLTTTANYNSQRASGQKLNLEPNTTYTVSGKLVSHTGTGNVSVVEILSGTIGGVTVIKREYITADGTFSYSVTTPGDVSKLWVSFSSVGADTQATFGDLQIEKGSTVTTYAPYVAAYGKNLLNLSEFVKGRVDNGVIGYASDTSAISHTNTMIAFTTTSNYRGIVSGLIAVKPNTAYTSSVGSATSGTGTYADFYDENGDWISRSASGLNISTPANCAYIRVSYQLANTGSSTIANPMVEENSTATTFEPCISGKVELSKNSSKQDYLYKSGGNWFFHKELDNLVLSYVYGWWISGDQGDTVAQFATGIGGVALANSDGFSNRFSITDSTDWYANYLPNKILFSGSNIYIRVPKTIATTAPDWETYNAAHYTNVVYALTNAYDIKLTDATLISQLDALAGAKIMVDGGTATVTSQYLPATLTTAYNSNSGYIDYIYDGTNFVKVR